MPSACLYPRAGSFLSINFLAGKDLWLRIYLHGRLLIHQPSVPGLPGNDGFRRKKDAAKVAVLVIEKIRQHVFPPSISRAELDSLHIKL